VKYRGIFPFICKREFLHSRDKLLFQLLYCIDKRRQKRRGGELKKTKKKKKKKKKKKRRI
tara:strand:- start:1874 stop:2053 length:180 start_codon:yes stop_codon:yes gene_type:complete